MIVLRCLFFLSQNYDWIKIFVIFSLDSDTSSKSEDLLNYESANEESEDVNPRHRDGELL